MIHWRLNVENSTHLHFDQGHMEFKPLGKSIALERSSPTHTRVFKYLPKNLKWGRLSLSTVKLKAPWQVKLRKFYC